MTDRAESPPAVPEVPAASAIPTTWLDPLLTGPDAVIGRYPYSGDDIERLLAAIRKRIMDGSGDGVWVSRNELKDAIEELERWRDKGGNYQPHPLRRLLAAPPTEKTP